jgi:hypothetical protein
MICCQLIMVVIGDEIVTREVFSRVCFLGVWLLPIHQLMALMALSVVPVGMHNCCLLKVFVWKALLGAMIVDIDELMMMTLVFGHRLFQILMLMMEQIA